MKPDLTIIFLTTNQVPQDWADYHFGVLEREAGKYPIIMIGRSGLHPKMRSGDRYLLDDAPLSWSNFYRQMLRAAKEAETDYIAIAEDDTLYTADHFRCFRPDMDTVAYNQNRWSTFTWDEKPVYSRKDGKVGAACIAPRELVIEALEERFRMFPDGIPQMKMGEIGIGGEKEMGFTERKSVSFYSDDPIVQVNHDFFSVNNTGPEAVARRHKKQHGKVKAYSIPCWGYPENIIDKFV